MAYKFSVSVSTDKATGRTLAVYFQIREGKAAEVREIEEGTALANYDRRGRLLGIEILAPCQAAVLDRIVRKEPKPKQASMRKFFRNSSPRAMVTV